MREPAIDQVLSQTVLDEAARAFGRKDCPPKIGNSIRSACAGYLSGVSSSARSRHAYALRQSALIAQSAHHLRGLLEECLTSDVPNSVQDELMLALFAVSKEHFDHNTITELMLELGRLEDAARKAPTLYKPDKGGREPDIEFHVMIAKLKGLYEAVTGRKAKVTWHEHRARFEGKFLAFMSPILAATARARGQRPVSDLALGSLLKRVTREQRRPSATTGQGA